MTIKNQRLRVDNYLYTAGYYYGRSLMTAIRIGTNKLEVEMGRREGKHLDLRVCKQCNSNQVEDEFHFIAQCPLYNNLRDKLFLDICNTTNSKWKLDSLDPNKRFLFLVNGSGDQYEYTINSLVQKYLIGCWKLRK